MEFIGANRQIFNYVMVELVMCTQSDVCRSFLRKTQQISSLSPTRDPKENLHTWRLVAENLGPRKLTGKDYLNEYNHAAYLLFLAEQAPKSIDKYGEVGWELFFTMLPTWQEDLADLPMVVSSVLDVR